MQVTRTDHSPRRPASVTRQTDRDPYRGRDPREIPAYDSFHAGHYLRIPENTIRNWAFGRAYPTRADKQRWTKPLIRIADSKQHLLSFVNLLELHVLGALRRDHHVEMRNIRRAIEYLNKKLPSPHPLVDLDVETDGTDIFVTKYGSLINASRDGQLAMKVLLEAHLRRIERDARGVAIRLFPFTRPRIETSLIAEAPRLVAIDPAIAFGRPVIAGSRVPTIEVFERFHAGESPDELAEDFGRTKDEVLEAIRCEAEAA
jgi:uncharacterized protein (DUF433 family)